MSKFVQFYEASTSEANVAELMDILEKHNAIATPISKLTDETIELGLIPFAKKLGFQFSLTEVKEYFASQVNADLSDDELESVAGGGSKPPFNCYTSGPVICLVAGAL